MPVLSISNVESDEIVPPLLVNKVIVPVFSIALLVCELIIPELLSEDIVPSLSIAKPSALIPFVLINDEIVEVLSIYMALCASCALMLPELFSVEIVELLLTEIVS